jgi:NAD(P)-dependent dehydrogenase (short-subunit alcohol dehydrogenase family)
MDIRFDGKTAVVFGGSRGIGRAISIELAKGGATVYVASRQAQNAEKTCNEIVAMGLKAAFAAVEVSDFEQVDGFLARAEKETGRLDIVINNAGIIYTAPFLDAKTENIKRLIDVNILGVNNGTQAAIKRMIPYGEGKIVNVSSFTGRRPAGAGFPHYGMTKAAVLYLSETAAYTAAPHKINVNTVCPGIIRTDIWEEILDDLSAASGGDREEIWKDCLAQYIPLARGDQKSEDIAYAALFLCSEFADHITGHAIYVDGGAAME